jgi:hypothetical protein
MDILFSYVMIQTKSMTRLRSVDELFQNAASRLAWLGSFLRLDRKADYRLERAWDRTDL